MRIIFFGSPAEAADSLESLIGAEHVVVAVYTQPDRKSGRGRALTPTPVKIIAETHGLPVFTPKSLKDNEEDLARLVEMNADVFVVVAYGRILPPEILQIPSVGIVNIHPSLLPLYRGPSPVVTAILDGQAETGVTVMLLDEGMDTGPILAQSEPIRLRGDEKGAELQASLFKEGGALLPGVLEGLRDGSIVPTPQDESQATVTSLLERSDGEIAWSMTSEQIDRMVRAYDPWPGTFTSWDGKGLKILDARLSRNPSSGAGVVSTYDDRIVVGTGEGSIELKRLQLEGRQAIAAADFLRGQPDFAGAILGD
ncbi:MAG: methionyl-tRNA formyltransferase [Chloroflexi bacterium]|nr:methionyl-tRNA formyltransferase [Chloroflexota bacterium]